MADEKSVTVQVGPGFCGTLAIVFIVLKLCHVIEWSWLWVLSPLWLGFAALILFIIFIFGFALLMEILK